MLETGAISDPWVIARIENLITYLQWWLETHPETNHFIEDVALGTNQGINSKLLALQTIDYTQNREEDSPFDGVASIAFKETILNAIELGAFDFCQTYFEENDLADWPSVINEYEKYEAIDDNEVKILGIEYDDRTYVGE